MRLLLDKDVVEDRAPNTDMQENTLPAATLSMCFASGANPVAAMSRPEGACNMRPLLLRKKGELIGAFLRNDSPWT